jgi:hypothetical protein
MNVREYRRGIQKGQSRETGNIGDQDNIEAVNCRRTDNAVAEKKNKRTNNDLQNITQKTKD